MSSGPMRDITDPGGFLYLFFVPCSSKFRPPVPELAFESTKIATMIIYENPSMAEWWGSLFSPTHPHDFSPHLTII